MTITETRSMPRPRSDILVGGDWKRPAAHETIPVVNPSDGQRIGEIARGMDDRSYQLSAISRQPVTGGSGRIA